MPTLWMRTRSLESSHSSFSDSASPEARTHFDIKLNRLQSLRSAGFLSAFRKIGCCSLFLHFQVSRSWSSTHLRMTSSHLPNELAPVLQRAAPRSSLSNPATTLRVFVCVSLLLQLGSRGLLLPSVLARLLRGLQPTRRCSRPHGNHCLATRLSAPRLPDSAPTLRTQGVSWTRQLGMFLQLRFELVF